MKHLINITKHLSLLLIISAITFALYAQNKYSDYLAINNKLSIRKTSFKTTKPNTLKLAILDDLLIKDTYKDLEDWMFNLKCIPEEQEDRIELEPWMFNSENWNINKMIWEEEPIEEPSEIEPWMLEIKIINSPSVQQNKLHYPDCFIL